MSEILELGRPLHEHMQVSYRINSRFVHLFSASATSSPEVAGIFSRSRLWGTHSGPPCTLLRGTFSERSRSQ